MCYARSQFARHGLRRTACASVTPYVYTAHPSRSILMLCTIVRDGCCKPYSVPGMHDASSRPSPVSRRYANSKTAQPVPTHVYWCNIIDVNDDMATPEQQRGVQMLASPPRTLPVHTVKFRARPRPSSWRRERRCTEQQCRTAQCCTDSLHSLQQQFWHLW